MRSGKVVWNEFTFYSKPGGEQVVEHASGLCRIVSHGDTPTATEETAVADLHGVDASSGAPPVDGVHASHSAHYSAWRNAGFDFGPTFRGLQGASVSRLGNGPSCNFES
ncbi:hypothetical protein CDD83_8462 [Cordyceps sp. RAO-2017]|nr:hypothetical protein CDD83_8462 [Cordyceps sp. RAO-2017]